MSRHMPPLLFPLALTSQVARGRLPLRRSHADPIATSGNLDHRRALVNYRRARVAGMTGTTTTALRRIANPSELGSFSTRMRERRFELFERLAASFDRPLRVIDVGGTNEYWEQRGWAGREDVQITLVNLEAEPVKFA